jgi:hypothetical protein
MTKINAAQAAEMLGIKHNVINKLVKQGLLTNLNASSNGKRTTFWFPINDVKQLKRFYTPRGQMWKKEYRQFLATGVAPIVVPKAKVAVVRAKVVAAALDAPKPMVGLLSRLAAVESKLDLLLEKVASLDALWR